MPSKTLKRQYFSILILAFWVAAEMLPAGMMLWQKQQFTAHFKQKLESRSFQEKIKTVVLTPQAYSNAHEGSKELRLNGSIYDIIQLEVKNGKIVVQCFEDNEENKFEFTSKLLQKRSRKKCQALLKNQLNKIHYEDEKLSVQLGICVPVYFPQKKYPLPKIIAELPLQPPEFC